MSRFDKALIVSFVYSTFHAPRFYWKAPPSLWGGNKNQRNGWHLCLKKVSPADGSSQLAGQVARRTRGHRHVCRVASVRTSVASLVLFFFFCFFTASLPPFTGVGSEDWFCFFRVPDEHAARIGLSHGVASSSSSCMVPWLGFITCT